MADEDNFDMEPITGSSQISEVGYNAESRELRIRFIYSSALYAYYGVPEEVYVALRHAPSVGSYFSGAIKGSYPYQRIE